eukprot:TRINITY_DN32987_c0_g1_i1.p1 TRINITY_DN32987_c0_g1~~TRINITY_DN32987_c0_g1_i1.p1  ORF type:complete len:483 (-),score=83.45 TRINITY_DN32987_c0_g1_i1:542-1918(-)
MAAAPPSDARRQVGVVPGRYGVPDRVQEPKDDDDSDSGASGDELLELSHEELGDLAHAEANLLAGMMTLDTSWKASIPKITALLQKRHGDYMTLRWQEGRGRALCTRRAFKSGDKIMVDRPMMLVEEPPEGRSDRSVWDSLVQVCTARKLAIEPIWFLAALSAACTKEQLAKVQAALAGEASPGHAVAMEAPLEENMDAVPRTLGKKRASADATGYDSEGSDEASRPLEPLAVDVDEKYDRRVSDGPKGPHVMVALQPPSAVVAKRFEMLYRERPTEPSLDVMTIVYELELAEYLGPLEVEDMLNVLIFNAYECAGSKGQKALGLYFTPSFVSHSCMPNAEWNFNEDGSFALVARAAIAKHSELTVSYLPEEDLILATSFRRSRLLESKRFICTCVRCVGNDDIKPYTCYICGQILLYGQDAEQLMKYSFCRRLITQAAVNSYVLSHMVMCSVSGGYS